MWRTVLLARLGRVDEAWGLGRDTLRLITETGWRAGERRLRSELGLLELSRHNADGALEILDGFGSDDDAQRSDGIVWKSALRAEVLIGLGRNEEAGDTLAELDESRRLGWVDAHPVEVQRVRALLAAARGDLDEATQLVTEAVDEAGRRADTWELARSLLAAGEIHRRARRRARARAAFTEAATLFDRMGAVTWANNARQELGRIGGRRDADGELTATQRQVAELVVEGMTNRQVADRLFMSVHTVEAHLSAIYRALDIGSRADLRSALRRLPDTVRDSTRQLRDSAPAADRET
jgi:DNA-binding CsgD family transcriptional regulator